MGVASTFDVGGVTSLDAVGEGLVALRRGGDIAASKTNWLEASCLEVALLTLDGLVNAFSRFSLSLFSSCSTRFLLGAKTTAGLTRGSCAVGTAAFRCSSMSMRGAAIIVLLAVIGLNVFPLGVKIPGRPAGFWKWPIAFASFLN